MAIKKTISATTTVEKKTKTTRTSSGKTTTVKTPKSPIKKVAKTATKVSLTSGGKTAVKKQTTKQAAKKTTKKAVAAKSALTAGKKQENPSKKLIDAVVEGILEIKGKNIAILDLNTIHNRVCDYYIICQADSSTQVSAIANSVEEIVRKRTGERPYHSEGFQNSEWILIDYVNVVVHVFQSHIREFYNLEALWADAEVTKIAYEY